MSQSPMLRLEVEGVKHSLLQHLGGYSQMMEEMVEQELASIDIEAALRAEIQIQAPQIIKNAVADAGARLSKAIADKLVSDFRDEVWEWRR